MPIVTSDVDSADPQKISHMIMTRKPRPDIRAARPSSADAGNVHADITSLVDRLEGEARAERESLIGWLVDRGFDVDQIRDSLSPMLLPANRVFGDTGTFVSAKEVADSGGVPVELVQRLHRAAGLARVDDPSKAMLSRADAESVLPAAALVEVGIDPDQVVQVVRLLMEGLTHAAVAMRRAALQALLRPGTTELELAQAFEALAQDTQPLIDPIISEFSRLALRHTFETEAVSAAERAAGALPGARPVTVAFADLVEFTRLGEALPPEELGQVAERLANLTRDVVTEPVHFVKTIGDAVMLVSADPERLLTAVLELMEAAADDHFPRLRAGVAAGQAVSWAGDWYGSPVNLASRVTGAAPPGAVLAAESARTAIGETPGIAWSFVGTRQFKGIQGEVALYRADKRPAE